MFELDKQQFRSICRRSAKTETNDAKDLAQKLMISDKAVSKWERGLNMPDITLLVPLAQALDVSVAELLECRRISQSEPMSAHQVDKLVKSDNDERGRSADEKAAQLEKWLAAFALFRDFSGRNRSAAALSSSDFHGVQRFISSGAAQRDLWSLLFCLFAREKLPAYYDENKISSYSSGVFRMNLAGVYFNNRNWPHIMKAGRNWALSSLVLMPVLYGLLTLLFQGESMACEDRSTLTYLAGLLIPMIYAGKKYE